MDASVHRNKIKMRVAGLVGILAGILFGQWAGFAFLWPAAIGALAAGFLMQFGPADRAFLTPIVAVQIGHVGWMLLGVLLLGKFEPVLIDAVLLSLGTQWLYNQPTLRAVYANLILCFLEAGFTAYQLVELPVGRSNAVAVAGLGTEALTSFRRIRGYATR